LPLDLQKAQVKSEIQNPLQREVTMKYMLLIYGKESDWSEEERESCMLESMQICKELEAQGKWIASSPLLSVQTATSVRVRQGKRQVTDGPFAETVEQLGGYYIIDVEHLDEAIAIAARIPPAKKGTVEIRPLFDLSTLPAGQSTAAQEAQG
jgi:hypothetical protein